MDIKTIESLMRLFDASTVTNFHFSCNDFSLQLSKGHSGPAADTQTPFATPVATLNQVAAAPAAEIVPDNLIEIRAPLVGIYYAQGSPETPPFVKVGQKVKKGDVLCIIEAMKIMNEVVAPANGIIHRIDKQNEEVVGYHEVLMTMLGEDDV